MSFSICRAGLLVLAALCLLAGCGRSASPPVAAPVATSEPPAIETGGANRDVAALAKQLIADWSRPQVPVPVNRKWVCPERFSTIKYVVFSKDGSRIALYTGGEIVVLDAATGKTVWKRPGQLEFANGAVSLAISPNGRRIMMDSQQTEVIETWDTSNGKLIGLSDRSYPVHFAGTSSNDSSVFAIGRLSANRSEIGSEQAVPKSYEVFWTDGSSHPIPMELGKLYVETIRPTGSDERYLLIDQFGGVHQGKRNGFDWTTEVVCGPPPDEATWNSRQRIQKVAESATADSSDAWLVSGRNKQWSIVPTKQLERAKEGSIELPGAQKPGDRSRVDLKSIAAGVNSGTQNVREVRLSPDGKHAVLIGSALTVVALERPGYSIPSQPLGTTQENPQAVAISYDARSVATKLRVKNGITLALVELGEIPASRGQRVEDWARKALEEGDHELIEAVLKAAEGEKAAPSWLATDAPTTEPTPLMGALVHVLRESSVPVWARRYREKSDAWATSVGRPLNSDFPNQKEAAKAAEPILVNGERRWEDNPEAQQLVERMSGGAAVTPEDTLRFLTLTRKGVIPNAIFVNGARGLSGTGSIDDPSVQAVPNAMLEIILVDGADTPAAFPVAFINLVVDRYERESGLKAANRALAILCVDLARRRQLVGYAGMTPSGAASLGQSIPEEVASRGDFDETRAERIGAMSNSQELYQITKGRPGEADQKELALYYQRRNNELRRTVVRNHFDYRRLADGLLQLLREAPQGTDLKATSDEFYDAEAADHRDIALVAIRMGYDAGDKELVHVASEVLERYTPTVSNPALFPGYRYDLPAMIEWGRAQ